MELQRIIAPDARQATAEVARRFGPHALIVSSRMLIQGRTEVIVAIETATPASESESLNKKQEPTAEAGKFNRLLGQALGKELPVSATDRPVTPPSRHPLANGQSLKGDTTESDPLAGEHSLPTPHRDPEGEAMVRLIRSELAELRAELSAMRQRGQNHPAAVFSKQFARRELTAAGFASGPLEDLLAKVGDSVDLPVLSDALRALLESRQPALWSARAHVFHGDSWSDCTDAMLALAQAQESAAGPGSACIISLADQDGDHWARLHQACLSRAIGVMRLKDARNLSGLLDHLARTSTACFLADPGGETESLWQDNSSCKRQIERHLVVAPGHNVPSDARIPFPGASWDSIIVNRLERPGALLPLVSLALAENLAISATTHLADGKVEHDHELARLATRALAHLSDQLPTSEDHSLAELTMITKASLDWAVTDALLP